MKKTLLFAAFAAAALVSCSKDQVVDAPKDAIKFSVVTDNATKAVDVYCSNNMMPSFTVSAATSVLDEEEDVVNVSTYMSNEEITQNGSSWSSSIQRYWPEAGQLYFIANNIGGVSTSGLIHNASIASGYEDSNLNDPIPARSSFMVNKDVAKQVDFVYAVSGLVSKPTDNTVTLNFRHALSMLEFQIKNQNPTLHVVANAVSVKNVLGYGSFIYPTASTNKNTNTQGSGNIGHGSQAITAGLATGTWDFYNIDQAGWEGYSSWEDACIHTYTANIDAVEVKYNANPDAEAISLTFTKDIAGEEGSYKNSMLVIPHSSNETLLAGSTHYLAVKCTIYNVTNPTSGYNATTDKTIVHDGWAVVPFTYDWYPGCKFVYTFVFGNGDGGIDGGNGDEPVIGDDSVLLPIDYTVTVDSFINFENVDVNMDSGN